MFLYLNEMIFFFQLKVGDIMLYSGARAHTKNAFKEYSDRAPWQAKF